MKIKWATSTRCCPFSVLTCSHGKYLQERFSRRIMDRLDKSSFKKQSFKEADSNRAYWMSKTPMERLIAAYHLSLRAYGYDPDNPPPMDKTYFTRRKRD